MGRYNILCESSSDAPQTVYDSYSGSYVQASPVDSSTVYSAPVTRPSAGGLTEPPPGHVYDEYSGSYVRASPVDIGTVYSAPVTQPFKPSSTGLASFFSNTWGSAVEVAKQRTPDFLPPPSFEYKGPLGGAGPLGLLAPAPGSQKYEQFVERQRLNEFNPKKSGIAPLPDNTKTIAIETSKQIEGPNWWEKFSGAVKEGYTKEPEDVNVFTESVKNAGSAMAGIVPTSNYSLVLIGGAAILLLILIIK